MEEWLKNPVLLEADKEAEYAEVIEINMDEIKEIHNAYHTSLRIACMYLCIYEYNMAHIRVSVH